MRGSWVRRESVNARKHALKEKRATYLSSSPPSLLIMFLKEKIVPKINLASSSLESSFRLEMLVSPLLKVLDPDNGRFDLLSEVGRGVHFRL